MPNEADQKSQILDIRKQIEEMLNEDVPGKRLMMEASPPLEEKHPSIFTIKADILPKEGITPPRPRANPLITLEHNPKARITKDDIHAAILSARCLVAQNEALKEFVDDTSAKEAIDLAQNTLGQLESLWIEFHASIFQGGQIDRSLLANKD